MALLKDSLIAHYKMNDNLATAIVIDETGNHNGEYRLNNVAQNTSTGASSGKILGALDFVGGANGEHTEIPNHDDFDGLTQMSWSFWVNSNDIASSQLGFLSKYIISTGFRSWVIRSASAAGEIELVISSNGTTFEVSSSTFFGLTTGVWIHIGITYNAGVIKFYKDGIFIQELTNSKTFIYAGEAPVHIGRYASSFFNGLIDNVMFFNKVLTSLEVKYLYNSGGGVESIPTLIELSRTGHRFLSFPEN